MSLRDIWRNLSVDTLLSLPPTELLSVIILCVLALLLALGAASLLLVLTRLRH